MEIDMDWRELMENVNKQWEDNSFDGYITLEWFSMLNAKIS